MIKVCYLFSQGSLAFAIYLFRNSLVLHKIDALTSVSIHFLPMITMYQIRWFTIPIQNGLPINEQRFVDLPVEDTWGGYFWSMLLWPILAYLIWSITYSMFNFMVCKERIIKKKRSNLYFYFLETPSVAKFCAARNWSTVSPFAFMVTHFIMFFITHLIAMACYHSFWLNSFLLIVYAFIAVWNGACFYMEYFAKKYEAQLAELEQTVDKDK